MFASSIVVLIVTLVVSEAPNVAASDDPLGTVSGVQLAAVFQSLLIGLAFQVALPARVEWLIKIKARSGRNAALGLMEGGRKNPPGQGRDEFILQFLPVSPVQASRN